MPHQWLCGKIPAPLRDRIGAAVRSRTGVKRLACAIRFCGRPPADKREAIRRRGPGPLRGGTGADRMTGSDGANLMVGDEATDAVGGAEHCNKACAKQPESWATGAGEDSTSQMQMSLSSPPDARNPRSGE